MDISNNIKQLKEDGYTIIHNVYNEEEIIEYWNEFNLWHTNVPELKELHNLIDFNGIFKHHQVGHQRFAWLARTNHKILNIFKQLWNTDDIVCSFDGCCYYSPEYIGKPVYWTHTDQSSRKKGLNCYQSFLSLTNNKERTLLLYKGSHLLHEDYFKTMEIDEPRDWNILDQNYIQQLIEDRLYLDVKAGELVIWDSRTFHQNTCGDSSCCEERLVQYLCYLPKDDEKNDTKQRNQRKKYFEKLRTTSHWPYPMNVVPEQPNMYNYYNSDFPITIDYDSLPKPNIDDLKEEIEKLL
tara:strand:+ start:1565 stop:2449 length:885 start_codon:yes stop_codon:yes gene_type:complete